MTIKSDKWIRRMAREQGMIEPFEERQVREGVVSYGLSSYGYDMRVADEFKIFANVFGNVVVDPKNIDEKAFHNVKADHCIIPPNSFALCHSVERFRIPTNVLCVVLGKSTYARCFSGSTRVALVDGTSPSLEEMARRAESGEIFWGYSMSEYGRVTVTLLDAPRHVGRDSLIELVLDNGEPIRCTPDHEFIRRDGRLARADELRPGDSLMPLYRTLIRGHESVYQPLNAHLTPTHRLADEWNVRNGLYPDVPGTHRHHRDHDRLNNRPTNIERVPAAEHIRHHDEITFGEELDPEEHGQSIRDALARLAEEPEWRAHHARLQRERALPFWHEEPYERARQELRRRHVESWTPERRRERAEMMRARYRDPVARALQSELVRQARASDPQRRERQREVARAIRLREEITEEVVRKALDATGSFRGAARLLDCDRAVFRRFPDLLRSLRGQQPRSSRPGNHRITSIRRLPGDHDVFCLTVPEAGNFALHAGVFTLNCGIVVNVTPLEPGWEGHVTIEISNTTPLPAKVYANEGLCQVLFFESDERCETSYADRAGKYQQQPARIVLPRL